MIYVINLHLFYLIFSFYIIIDEYKILQINPIHAMLIQYFLQI